MARFPTSMPKNSVRPINIFSSQITRTAQNSCGSLFLLDMSVSVARIKIYFSRSFIGTILAFKFTK